MQNRTDDPMDEELRALRDRRLAELTGPQGEPTPSRPLPLTDATLDAAIAGHAVLVVDVWAPWCGPCRIVGPVLDELARDLAGQVTFGKVNADENRATMERYGIRGIPTMLIFKNGRLVDQIVGAAPKDALKSRFLAHAAG
jgi:thioredoxin 1